MNETTPAPIDTKDPSRVVWTIGICLFGAGIVAYEYFNAPGLSTDLGLLAGYSILKVILLWVCFHIVLRQHNDGRIGCTTFLVLWVWFVLGGLAATLCPENATARSIYEMQDAFAKMLERLADPSCVKDLDARLLAIPDGSGDYGKLTRCYKRYLMDVAVHSQQNRRDGEAANWRRILGPDRIWADLGFEESRKIIRSFRRITKGYEDWLEGQIENTSEEILQLDVDNDLKLNVIDLVKSDFYSEPAKEFRDSIEASIVTVESLIDFLESRKR